MVTDSAGQVVALHDYAPFGEEIPGGQYGRGSLFGVDDGLRQRFTGQKRDAENTPALVYFPARHLAPVLGVFLQPDPGNAGADLTNPQSWNGYGYVLENPLSFTDPTGMFLEASNKGGDEDSLEEDGCQGDYFDCPWCIFYAEGSTQTGGGSGGGGSNPPPPAHVNISAPAKNGTPNPCVGADPNKLDFFTPRLYPSDGGRTISPYQQILERHVLPNSKPGTTRYVFGSDFTGVHSPAQTMTAVISLDRLTGIFNATNITDSNGNAIGTPTYVSNGGADYYANRNGVNLLATTAATVGSVGGVATFYGASALAGACLAFSPAMRGASLTALSVTTGLQPGAVAGGFIRTTHAVEQAEAPRVRRGFETTTCWHSGWSRATMAQQLVVASSATRACLRCWRGHLTNYAVRS